MNCECILHNGEVGVVYRTTGKLSPLSMEKRIKATHVVAVLRGQLPGFKVAWVRPGEAFFITEIDGVELVHHAQASVTCYAVHSASPVE